MSSAPFALHRGARLAFIAEWEYNVEGKGDDENFKWWCSTDYMIKHYGSKEAYAEIESTVFWRAVVTPDGEWHEVGQTGWFGAHMESGEQYASLGASLQGAVH